MTGWEMAERVKLLYNEVVIDKKYNCTFKNTMMHQYLQSKDIQTIILVGIKVNIV